MQNTCERTEVLVLEDDHISDGPKTPCWACLSGGGRLGEEATRTFLEVAITPTKWIV